MEIGVREATIYLAAFAVFFACPLLNEYMHRKWKTRVLGLELAALILPAIAGVGFYEGSRETGLFGLFATAGMWLGIWMAWRSEAQRST